MANTTDDYGSWADDDDGNDSTSLFDSSQGSQGQDSSSDQDDWMHLSPFKRLEKICNDTDIYKRQLVGRTAPGALVSVADSSFDVARILLILNKVSNDPEVSVRLDLAESLPHICLTCHSRDHAPQLRPLVLSHLLPLNLRLLGDPDIKVRKAAQKSLIVLIENDIIDSNTIENLVCTHVISLANSDDEIHIMSAVELMSTMAPLIAWELTETVFVPKLLDLFTSTQLNVRLICATKIGDFCAAVSQDTIEKSLLPAFIDLTQDPTWNVRKACAQVIMSFSCALPLDLCKRTLAPIFSRFLSDDSRWVRVAAFQTLGPFITTFARPSITGLAYNQSGELVLVNPDGFEFKFLIGESMNNQMNSMELGMSGSVRLDMADRVSNRSRENSNSQSNTSNITMRRQNAVLAASNDDDDDWNEDDGYGMTLEEDDDEDEQDQVIDYSRQEEDRTLEQTNTSDTGSNETVRVSEDEASSETIPEEDNYNYFQYWRDPIPSMSDVEETLANNTNLLKLSDSFNNLCSLVDSPTSSEPPALPTNPPPSNTRRVRRYRITSFTKDDIRKTTKSEEESSDNNELDNDNTESTFENEEEEDDDVSSTAVKTEEVQEENEVVVKTEEAQEENAVVVKTEDLSKKELNKDRRKSSGESSNEEEDDEDSDSGNEERNRQTQSERTNTTTSGIGSSNDLDDMSPQIPSSACDQHIVPQELIDYYVKMFHCGTDKSENSDLARYCAFSLPAVALTLGSPNWSLLRPVTKRLACDEHWKVRRIVAASMHELAVIVGPEAATRDLLPVYTDLIKDLDEVRIGALRILSRFLYLLKPEGRLRFLPMFNKFLATDYEWNWRFRSEFVTQLGLSVGYFLPQQIWDYLAPLALLLLSDKVAAVRRVAVDLVDELFVHLSPSLPLTRCLTTTLAEDFAHSTSWTQRQTFASLCARLVTPGPSIGLQNVDDDLNGGGGNVNLNRTRGSSSGNESDTEQDQQERPKRILRSSDAPALPYEVFATDVLPHLIHLAMDPVPNVRLCVARTLSLHIAPLDFFQPPCPHSEVILETLYSLQCDSDADVQYYASLKPEPNTGQEYTNATLNTTESEYNKTNTTEESSSSSGSSSDSPTNKKQMRTSPLAYFDADDTDEPLTTNNSAWDPTIKQQDNMKPKNIAEEEDNDSSDEDEDADSAFSNSCWPPLPSPSSEMSPTITDNSQQRRRSRTGSTNLDESEQNTSPVVSATSSNPNESSTPTKTSPQSPVSTDSPRSRGNTASTQNKQQSSNTRKRQRN